MANNKNRGRKKKERERRVAKEKLAAAAKKKEQEKTAEETKKPTLGKPKFKATTAPTKTKAQTVAGKKSSFTQRRMGGG